ncbi:MAG TPA: HlyD family efflux transporter periplasmic adaptor subunit [Burkholderiaceae bacterium]|nr:HlyD family efflux transporter periplasmic adaptor subunit [Burkholderiaceae bacterium]
MVNLFRPEALESQRDSWLGEIQLVRPVSLAWLTSGVVLAVAAFGVALAFGEYTRKVRVAGVLVPDRGVVRLAAPQDGMLADARIAEGASVRAGDVLFVLSLDRSAAAGDTQLTVQRTLGERQRSLRNSESQQQQLLEAQQAALARRVADLQRDLAVIDGEASVLAQRIALAADTLARYESLQRDNFVSQAQVQAKAEDVLGLKAQAQALQRQRGAIAREIGTAQAQQRELPLQHAARHGEIERERSELEQLDAESEARRRLVVRAPFDGVVSTLSAQPGQMVSPTVPLATLVPSGSRLQAHLYAPSSAVGFLRSEQPVLLRYEAFPYQKFGLQHGRIASVSLTPMNAQELAAQPWAAAAREPMYRIAVTLERQDMSTSAGSRALVPGMQLEADVPIERRRLGEWLFAPVLGLAQRL